MRGPHGQELPGAVLFACTQNAVRSPMAAAILRHLLGKFVYVESAGVRAGEPDPFAVEVMDEIGIEIAKYKPKRFEELEDSSFDLVITLSPEAQHRAVDAVHVCLWAIFAHFIRSVVGLHKSVRNGRAKSKAIADRRQ